jgi:hypothetical protein
VNLQNARCNDKNNIQVCLCPVLPHSQRCIPLLEGSQASHLVFPTTAVFKLRCVWRTDGMTVNGKNWNTRTKTSSDSTCSPPIFPINDRGSNSALSVWRVRLHKDSVHTAQRTRSVATTTNVLWMLRREIFDVYWQKYTQLINTMCFEISKIRISICFTVGDKIVGILCGFLMDSDRVDWR